MIGKSPVQEQKNLFQPLLREFINLNHELVLLSEKINWKELEKEFSSLYSTIDIKTSLGYKTKGEPKLGYLLLQ